LVHSRPRQFVHALFFEAADPITPPVRPIEHVESLHRPTRMTPSHVNSIVDRFLPRSVATAPATAVPIEQTVLALFDRCAPSLQRYVASFGLGAEETEDIVQDVFLSLFRHLRLGRSRSNLKGWLFQVAHNRALKHRGRTRRRQAQACWGETAAAQCIDPAPNPETRLAERERRQRLTSVVRALPERDRRCLSLRAEGLRYRDIAAVLGVSLGAVAKSLTRAMARLANADER
jgi:RNA polymerase sigma-70 factor (ECF subfamily)